MAAAIQSGQFATLSNGMRLHYASAGEPGKPLLLFVHGFPEFWREWEAQLAEFGRDHYAVALDLRGFNLSDMPTEVSAYRARHIIEDLRLLADYRGDALELAQAQWAAEQAQLFVHGLQTLFEGK